MKDYCKFLLISLSLISFTAAAQERPVPSDRQKWVEQVVLFVGQRVKYKTIRSDQFVRGRILTITDSTVSFEDDIPGMVITVSHKNLSALKIYSDRGTPHVGRGVSLMLAGGVVMLISSVFIASGGTVGVVVGGTAMAGGLILILTDGIPKTRTIFLGNTWNIEGTPTELRIWH